MVGFEINISQDLFSILKCSFFSLFHTKELEKKQTNKKTHKHPNTQKNAKTTTTTKNILQTVTGENTC